MVYSSNYSRDAKQTVNVIYSINAVMKKIKFETALAKQLYIEVSAIQDMKKVNRSYISQEYIWKVWQKVYKNNCGCTRYYINI